MVKKTKENNQRSKTGWLRLTLELIVVFIGVSAGFLFDNFREEQSNSLLEDKYLESFYNNVRADSLELQNMIQSNQNNIDISGRTVALMQAGTCTNDSALLAFGVMATFTNLNMEDATYESLVNSGNLGLVSDFGIREKIVYYYRSHEDMRYVESVYNDYISSYILPYLTKKLDFISGEFVEEFNVNDTEFRNITAGYFTLSNQKMEIVQRLDSLNTDLKYSLAAMVNPD
jgi:hypothetical protein